MRNFHFRVDGLTEKEIRIWKKAMHPSSMTRNIFAWTIVTGIVIYAVGTLAPINLNKENIVLGTGDVQITLSWNNAADLDLHVVDPNGEWIWYNHRTASSGGQLDVDANRDCSEFRPSPIENIFWPIGRAPRGEYKVAVVYFKECSYSGPTNYKVEVRLDEQVVNVRKGTILKKGEEHLVINFSY